MQVKQVGWGVSVGVLRVRVGEVVTMRGLGWIFGQEKVEGPGVMECEGWRAHGGMRVGGR